MAEALLPKPRPADLKKLTEFPAEPPVAIPDDGSDAATLEWAERTRDHFEERGRLVTAKGLLKLVELGGLDDADTKEMKAQVKKLYKAEFDQAAGTSPKAKTPKEKKVTATAGKKSKAKNGKTSSTRKLVVIGSNGKPSKNGKAKTKAAPVKSKGDEATVVYQGNVKGLDVVVSETGTGRFRVNVGGFAARKVAAWLGKQGWSPAEARDALTKLLSRWKNGEQWVKEMIEEGHCGSGAKANKQGKYCFGYLPEITNGVGKALKALRKS